MIKLKIEIKEVSSNGGEWVLTVDNKLRGIYCTTKRLKDTIQNCIDEAIANEEETIHEC